MADDLLTMKIAIDDRDYLKVQRSQKNFQYSLVEIERAYRNNEINAKQYNRQLVIQTKNLQKLGFTYSEASSQIRKYSYSLRNATKDQLNQAQAIAASGKGMRRFELIAQQAGYQVGDFAVQVQSGTNVAVAFGQQMSQLLGFFGAGGALAGAAIAIGTAFVAPLMRAKEEVESLQDTTSKAIDELEAKLRQTRLGVSKEEIGFIDRLAEAQSKYEEALENYNIERNSYLQNPTMTPKEIEDLLSVEAENMKAAREEAAQAADEYERFLAARTAIQGGADIDAFGGEGDPLYSPEVLEATEEWLEGFEERRQKLAASRFAAEMAHLKAVQDARNEELKIQEKIDNLYKRKSQSLSDQILKNHAILDNQNDELGLLEAQQKIRYNNLLRFAEENDLSLEQKSILKAQLINLFQQEKQLLKIKLEEKERVKRAKELKELMDGLEFPDYGQGVVAGDVFDPRGETGLTQTEALRRRLAQGRTNVNIENTGKGGGKSDFQSAMEKYQEFLKELELEERISRELVDVFGSERDIQEELMRLKHEYAILGKSFDEEEVERTLRKIEANEQLRKQLEEQKKLEEELYESMKGHFEDAMMSFIDHTKTAEEKFKDFANAVIQDLYRILVVQQTVNAAVAGIKALSGGGSFLSGFFGGFMADGGQVSNNKAYIVGEEGPEVFMPRSQGTIIPNDKLGGGGNVTVVQHLNISTGVQQTVRTEIRQMMPQIAESAKAAVLDSKRRGGNYGRALA